MKHNNFFRKNACSAGCICVLALFMVLSFVGCNNTEDSYVPIPIDRESYNDEKVTTDPTSIEETQLSTPTEVDTTETESNSMESDEISDETMMEIETPYLTLKYPMIWEDYIRFDITDDCVSFVGVINGKPEVRLFDVAFRDDVGTCMGYIEENGTMIPVSIVHYELHLDDSWNQGDQNTLYAMVEDVNLITDQISQHIRELDSEYYYIPAPYDTNLQYPLMWKESLVVQTTSADNALHFIAVLKGNVEVPLFDLYFGTEKGLCIGYLIRNPENIPVYLLTHELQGIGAVSDEELTQLYGMQESINVIIEGLVENGEFLYPDI